MSCQSLAEYVAECDEDQLINLIQRADARLVAIRQSGWVKLWTVSINWANVAWFAEDDYAAAVAWACTAFAEEAEAKTGKAGVEMEVKLERYRPDEVAGLLTRKGGTA